MPRQPRKFIPALNRRWLTPFYDPVMRYLMREETFRPMLIDMAAPQPMERILDLGCGTGTLTEMIQIRQPEATIVGIDIDPAVIKIAQRKMMRDQITQVHGTRGYTINLPFAEGSFNLVVTSMVLHHLIFADKRKTFQEVTRVLATGGRFCIVDYGPAYDGWMRLVTKWMIYLERAADNFHGAIPGMLSEVGFERIEESSHLDTAFGPLSFYRAYRRN